MTTAEGGRVHDESSGPFRGGDEVVALRGEAYRNSQLTEFPRLCFPTPETVKIETFGFLPEEHIHL